MSRPPLLHDPVSRLLELAERSQSRIIIALLGYPGSGKSTAANCCYAPAVEKQLGPGSIQVLGMDGFHLTKAELATMHNPEEARKRRGAPWTFNAVALAERLARVKAAESEIGWPGFDHGHGDPIENQIIVPPSTPLILVEGIYMLYRKGDWASLEGICDEHWFLDVDQEIALDRTCQRHQNSWGISEEQARERVDGNDRLNCGFIDCANADWRIPYTIN